jgi:curli biogenesis system outer membrane secretion channel CsgG
LTDVGKYNKLAILAFSDAPNSPKSGEIISALSSQCFAQAGFMVIERNRFNDLLDEQKLSNSGLIEDSQAIKLGKIMGVDAIVVGNVGQYSILEKHTDTFYQTQVVTPAQTRVMPDGSWVTVPAVTEQIAIPGRQWTESFVSVSLRVLDVESGQLLYSGSGQYDRGISKPPQMVAEEIIRGIVMGWKAH